jgi:hypothetical protein
MKKKILISLIVALASVLMLSSCAGSKSVYDGACANASMKRPSNYSKTSIQPAKTTPIRGNYNNH